MKYTRTTGASRRAEKVVRYIHESAPVITIPHPYLKDGAGNPVLTPVLRTRQYFPGPSTVFRGSTYARDMSVRKAGRRARKAAAKAIRRAAKKDRKK